MSLHHHSRPNIRKLLSGMIGLLLFLIPLASCSTGSSTTSQPTPTPTSGAGGLPFTTIDLKLPDKAYSAPIVGNLPDDTTLHLNFAFKLNQQVVNQLKSKQIKVGQTQNLQGVAGQLGISDETYSKIQTFLGLGNASLKLNKLHTDLAFDMKAGATARIFQTKFVLHQLNGRKFYTPDKSMPPKLPTFIANTLVAVSGLDSYTPPLTHRTGLLPFSLKNIASKYSTAANCSGLPVGSVFPADIARAYGYDQFHQHGWNGENITINLVEGGGIADPSDLQNYMSCVRYNTNNIQFINVGNPPAQNDEETTLDIDMIAGLASQVKMRVYQSDNSSFAQINSELQQIINDNTQNPDTGSVVSISLGLGEDQMTQNDVNTLHQSLDTLTNIEHMTVFVATGDCGAFGDGQAQQLMVSYPSTDPDVVAVGGTIMNADGSNTRYAEKSWSDSNATGVDPMCSNNDWGTGGGVSTFVSQPQWQQAQGVQNQYANGQRQVPDVSAIAQNLPIYFGGQWHEVGGTSAATPIWATGMALVNQGTIATKKMFVAGPQVFYEIADNPGSYHPYYDVTQGDNLYYQAGPGWDDATGLGTPNLVDFYKVIAAALH